ncbi:MAG: hypothetical protein H0T62_05395 [Parachlamydiaceae bacterium]|nr:hypothetical protein [Parachlamydiaceae bacterium]
MIIEVGCWFLVNWLVDRAVRLQSSPVENKSNQIYDAIIGKMVNLQCLPKDQAFQVCRKISEDLEGIETHLSIDLVNTVQKWNKNYKEYQSGIKGCEDLEKNLEDLEVKKNCLEQEVNDCMSAVVTYRGNAAAEKTKLSKRTVDLWQTYACKVPVNWVNWIEMDMHKWEILLKEEMKVHQKKRIDLSEVKDNINIVVTSIVEKIENVYTNHCKSELLDKQAKGITNKLIFVRTTKRNLKKAEDNILFRNSSLSNISM